MFLVLFVTFLSGVLGQVWYLIVSIPDLCLPYFVVLSLHLHVERYTDEQIDCNCRTCSGPDILISVGPGIQLIKV